MFRNIIIFAGLTSIAMSISCKKNESFVPFDYIMGTDLYAAPNTARPEKGVLHQDPTFLTTIARVTQKSDGYAGPGIENEYSRCDADNCDGTRLLLRANTAEFYLYDPATCQMIEQVNPFNDCVQEPEPRWDGSDPKVFFFLCASQLRSYNIDTRVSTTLHDFKDDFPNAYVISTKAEGDASLDRRYWCLMVEDSLYNLLAVVVFDRSADSVVGQLATGFPDALNWVSMDMSGAHALLGFESVNYVRVYDLAMSTYLDLPAGSNAHGDLAYDAAGQEVWVCQNTATDHISCYDLATGSETQLLPIPFDVNPDIGLHFSGNCDHTPGWVLVSTYGSYNPPPGETHSWMDCQLFMLELKSNPRVWRIAHTQSYTSRDYDGEKNYFAEAFASINRLGTRVYWGSNWRDYAADYTDAYQVRLPEDWTTEMP